MRKYWFIYTHNGWLGQVLVQSETNEGASHWGFSEAYRRYPGEFIEFLELVEVKQ